MITLTAKINLLSGENSALSLGSDNLSGNNISSKLRGIVGIKKKGSNPFIIGASKLGDGSTFSDGASKLGDGVGYFIGDKLSSKNGVFPTPYAITINSTKELNSLTIAFDDINRRHPKFINIYKKEPVYKNQELEIQKTYETSNRYCFYCPISKIENSSSVKINSIKDVNGNSLTKEDIEKYASFSYHTETLTEIYFYVFISKYEGYQLTGDSIFVEIEYIEGEKFVSTEYKDDDAIFTIANLNKNKDIIIEISTWNSPLYPLVITGIYAEVSIEIDRRNLISISRSIFDRSDLKLPSWGIISNTGNIEFNDTDGEIRDYAEQLLLESGLKCEIKLNNTLVDGASQTIGVFETDEWDYDNDNRVVSVSLKDDLEEWQDINVSEISYDPRKPENKPFNWLYEHLWKLTSNRSSYVNDKGETIIGTGNYNMLSIVELDEATQAVLNNTYIQYPLLESGSLWQQWTKLCQACQLHIYKNSDGVVVCRYNGGN